MKSRATRAARFDDVDAALARRGARVHDRDAARQDRPQHAGGGARREHVGAAALGQRAVVADAELPRCAPVPSATTSAAESIGQPNPRLQPLQLVGWTRREVHGVADDAVAQEIADGGGGFESDQLLRLFGRRRDVRRRDDLRQLGERPVGRRLLFEHVEAGAADDAAFDGAAQRRLVDQLAARRVDERMPGLQRAKRSSLNRCLVSGVDGRCSVR